MSVQNGRQGVGRTIIPFVMSKSHSNEVAGEVDVEVMPTESMRLVDGSRISIYRETR